MKSYEPNSAHMCKIIMPTDLYRITKYTNKRNKSAWGMYTRKSTHKAFKTTQNKERGKIAKDIKI